MPLETQFGTKDEVTYGTPVVVDRFEPFISESIQPETFRTRVPTLRSGKQTSGSTEYAAGILGYAGSVEIPALSKGFGLWLTRALGTTATAGPTDGAYTHTSTWAGSSLTVAAAAVPVTSITLSGDNKLKTDRHYQRANTRRDQAPRSDYPEITIEFEADWDSVTQYDRFVAETAAGTQAAVVWTCEAPTEIASGVAPGIVATMAAVDFTEVTANVSGPEMMMQTISGLVLDNYSAEPISVVYTSEDVTP